MFNPSDKVKFLRLRMNVSTTFVTLLFLKYTFTTKYFVILLNIYIFQHIFRYNSRNIFLRLSISINIIKQRVITKKYFFPYLYSRYPITKHKIIHNYKLNIQLITSIYSRSKNNMKKIANIRRSSLKKRKNYIKILQLFK